MVEYSGCRVLTRELNSLVVVDFLELPAVMKSDRHCEQAEGIITCLFKNLKRA